MKPSYNIISLGILLLLCLLSGCTLESLVERGDVCPPADMRNVTGELFASFDTLDCYESYVVMQSLPLSAQSQCSECEAKETMLGTVWICDGVTDVCYDELSDSLKKDYDNCKRYREYGMFEDPEDTDEKKRNQIAFIHDYKGEPVDMHDNGVTELSRYCPVQYSDCKFNLQPGPDEIAWFGCVEPCKFPYLYCYDGNGESVCVDPMSDGKHCGAKGGCSSDDPNSNDWKGEDCIGGSCEKGVCACPKGYAYCDIAGEDDICFDITNDRFHCGKDCIVCSEGDVCIEGECQTNPCVANHLCQQENKECRNTQKKCGASCMNCNEILNIDRSKGKKGAECNEDDGFCEIKDCLEGYHPAYDEHGEHQICKPNTETECASPSLLTGETIEEHFVDDCTLKPHQTSVICNHNGECEVLSCEEGFVPDGSVCVDDDCHCLNPNEKCIAGVCECLPGFTNCGKEVGCVDIIHDKQHCGGCSKSDVCDLDTKPETHATDAQCVHGSCLIQACQTDQGYHLYEEDNVCEPDDLKNCGAHGRICASLDTHFVEEGAECKEGKCVFTCSDDFHYYEEGCEHDDIQNCGGHDQPCEIENADIVVCENHMCLVSKCKINYHIFNNKCVPDDDNNCGEVDHVCDTKGHFSCQNGDCKCNTGYTSCIGVNGKEVCVDINSEHDHCGSCGHACPSDANCSGGACVCTGGKTLCGDKCVDTQSDVANCGGCGISCGGQACCNGVCTNLNNNDQHCGSCTKVCASDQSCVGTSCQCKTGSMCGTSCYDLQNDPSHCGSCNNSCGSGQSCSGGQCQCNYGTKCGNSCYDLSNDSSHCGSCSNSCGYNQFCSGGQCQCNYGTKCGMNCCNSDQYCSSGSCIDNTPSCNYWEIQCGSVCCDSNTQYCSGGRCYNNPVTSCPTGYKGSNCDQCDDGFTSCGKNYYDSSKPFCINMNEPSGAVHIYYCEDYCNTYNHWGGQGTKYYVTRCQPGQTCFLYSYASGQYVQCQ